MMKKLFAKAQQSLAACKLKTFVNEILGVLILGIQAVEQLEGLSARMFLILLNLILGGEI